MRINSISSASYQNTVKKNNVSKSSPSFGIQIREDREYAKLIDFWKANNHPKKSIDNAIKRINEMCSMNHSNNEHKITFFPIEKYSYETIINEGIFFDDAETVSYYNPKIFYNFSKPEEEPIYEAYEAKLKNAEPDDIVDEIQADYLSWQLKRKKANF